MLLHRSGLGGLLRRSAAPLSAPRKAMVPQSLGETFLASSSGTGAASRIKGTAIRSITKEQRHYGNTFNGTGSSKEWSKKKTFVEEVKDITKELIGRYWEPLNPGEKLIRPSTIAYCGFLLELSHTTKKQKQKKGSPF